MHTGIHETHAVHAGALLTRILSSNGACICDSCGMKPSPREMQGLRNIVTSLEVFGLSHPRILCQVFRRAREQLHNELFTGRDEILEILSASIGQVRSNFHKVSGIWAKLFQKILSSTCRGEMSKRQDDAS